MGNTLVGCINIVEWKDFEIDLVDQVVLQMSLTSRSTHICMFLTNQLNKLPPHNVQENVLYAYRFLRNIISAVAWLSMKFYPQKSTTVRIGSMLYNTAIHFIFVEKKIHDNNFV